MEKDIIPKKGGDFVVRGLQRPSMQHCFLPLPPFLFCPFTQPCKVIFPKIYKTFHFSVRSAAKRTPVIAFF